MLFVVYIQIYTHKLKKSIAPHNFFLLLGNWPDLRPWSGRSFVARGVGVAPLLSPRQIRAGLGSTTTTQSGAGSSPNLERWFERCVHKFRWSHGAGSRKAGMFAGVMVAPRPRRVRGRHAIWPRGSRYSPRRGAAANKKMGAQALRVKDGLKAQFTPPPTPSKKILYKIFLGVVAGECTPRGILAMASRPVRRRKSGRTYAARRRWFPVSDHWGFGPFRFPTCQYP